MRTASNASSQLVQLRKAKSLGTFYNHDRSIRHIHTYFDHGGGHHDFSFTFYKTRHFKIFRFGFHLPMKNTDGHIGKSTRHTFIAIHQMFEIQFL